MFTRGRMDRKADRHMQIGFLSNKWWPWTCWPCNSARSPVEHGPEAFWCFLATTLSFCLSGLYFYVKCCNKHICAWPKNIFFLPFLPLSFTLSPIFSFSQFSQYLHPYLVSNSGGQTKVLYPQAGWRLVYHCVCWSLSLPIITLHFSCLIYLFICYDKIPSSACTGSLICNNM